MSYIQQEDVVFEEDILRNPYSVKHWIRYLDHKEKADPKVRFNIYERALQQMPGSYKLWYRYLAERRTYAQRFPPTHHTRDALEETFVRALAYMHKMPRIWLEYLEAMMETGKVTATRRAFDEALRALAITQHHRIWPLYLQFVRSINVPETAVRVYRRYLMVEPEDAEEYVDYLISIKRFDEAATQLAQIVNKNRYKSKRGKSNHLLWVELCQLISKHPEHIHTLRVEPIIRGGLRRYTDMIGSLWCSLANYHIRSGNFEKVRDIYEEGLAAVSTVRDFSAIFEAYAEFEETSLNAMLEDEEQDEVELELRMARYENLMERRPLLLSSVLLRQNPHNVDEWLKRVMLFEASPKEMIRTFTEAVQTIDYQQAVGKPQQLWIEFAKLYESNQQLSQARAVFDRAVQQPFRKVDDLADVWCAFAEMEIRNKNYKQALSHLRRATHVPSRKKAAVDNNSVQMRVHRSLKLWSMYADLEESLGTFETTKAVYNRMIELRVANPQTILNFASFLEEHKYFEEAFSAYEKGLGLFRWPVVYEIWNVYLTKFIQRYGGRKLERTRELFEQCLAHVPDKFAKVLYLKYAQFEEDHGLARHAMAVYERATKAVRKPERYEMWQLYIKRAAHIFGVTHTRALYAKALEDDHLADKDTRSIALQFASLETKLGEIDRARAIYSHASQVADPRSANKYWSAWNDFEVRHGNEDTFREMLRIKRSVAAQFNTAANTSVFRAASDASKTRPKTTAAQDNAMAAAEEEASRKQSAKEGLAVKFVRSTEEKSKNTDEIALDDDDDDDDDEEDADVASGKPRQEIQERPVPEQVFGSLVGAKARFQQASE
ncbi:pre-mRNA-splicing factor SYF1 [Salpingoeca rosetta]|uniref:Pre-mRNA-splicing factor SYF1 n=1 Tax=Salpingoeca rosetta (strain ATCC 50818 / BSB-021) TaxID=946362 RepID=F2UHF7_SALR5|nr:pre-mRNA-splicing factor SYF1 [Salpingoeca rosetta]EGD76556.1 pre-mRNA-splicing factor SYF1 [Salpingoeca rosetta]|eukprot:XP_004991470.1 pre-mRNA-splicing factor SYF1 [Salpingoeca rosetta]